MEGFGFAALSREGGGQLGHPPRSMVPTPQLSQGTKRWEACSPSRWSKSQEGGTQQEASTVGPRVQGLRQSQNMEPQRAFLDASDDQEINWDDILPAVGRPPQADPTHHSGQETTRLLETQPAGCRCVRREAAGQTAVS